MASADEECSRSSTFLLVGQAALVGGVAANEASALNEQEA